MSGSHCRGRQTSPGLTAVSRCGRTIVAAPDGKWVRAAIMSRSGTDSTGSGSGAVERLFWRLGVWETIAGRPALLDRGRTRFCVPSGLHRPIAMTLTARHESNDVSIEALPSTQTEYIIVVSFLASVAPVPRLRSGSHSRSVVARSAPNSSRGFDEGGLSRPCAGKIPGLPRGLGKVALG